MRLSFLCCSQRTPISTSHTSQLLLAICLLLWHVSAKTAADYYVETLPGQPAGPLLKMHAGHIEVNQEHNGNLFFWHFQNRHIANRQRTVIWFNGGPGCSSMDGALMEIGPYRVKPDGNLRYSDGSWDEFANVLFIDNPVGTGYSYVDTDSYVHELKEMAEQIVTFLKDFFRMFPEYEDNDIYIAGESYAGQHIPYVAAAIQFNNKLPTQHRIWNLKGLLIGNGWISPVEQYDSYLTMAYQNGVIQGGSEEAKQLEKQHKSCTDHLNQPGGLDKVDLPACEQILQEILRLSQEDGKCYNMYDLRLRDAWPSCGMAWPPDLDQVTPYLRRQDVKDALHVNKAKQTGWQECSGAVGSAFKPVKSHPTIQMLPDIIKEIPIVLFSGDQDLICNHIGTEELIHNMEWNGGKGFELSPGTWAPRKHWTFEGEPAGLYQEARNLTYILFYNSSHMVPFDYPRRTRDMLDRFMNVDIASIGGMPADSRIDGEKGMETSVGGHPNSTSAEQDEAEKLEEAKWAAYYKSGEVALVVVVILASVWGFYVWRDRRRRAGYDGILGGSTNNLLRKRGRDVEAADFDESELDDLHVASPEPQEDGVEERYNVGGDSDDEGKDKSNGGADRHADGKDKPYKDRG